jgi:hypothetical protein
MAKSSSKVLILATAFALILFIGPSKPILAHPAVPMILQQGQGDQNNQKDDGTKQGGNQDLNDDRQDGPNENVQEGLTEDRNDDLKMDQKEGLDQNQASEVQEMNGAQNDGNLHESNIDEDRVQDQQQDQHENTPETPSGF